MTELTGRLAKIDNEIKAEENLLREKLAAVDKDRNAILADLERIRRLSRALHNERDGKKSRIAKGNGYTKVELVELAGSILKEHKQLTVERLKEEVLKAAHTSGKSGQGVAVRLKHALKDSRFKSGERGYSLS
jgi:hypothetical protein